MRRWLKIAVPMGIAAVLVTVLAIGFGSPSGEAACDTNMKTNGRVASGGSASYEMGFCSDPTDGFAVYLTWGNYRPEKDLALLVTDPNGNQYFVDHEGTAAETFIASPPLAEGTWQVTVVNVGSHNVKYELSMGFG